MGRSRLALIAAFWLALAAATSSHADALQDGDRALKHGDLATAHRLLRPLADRGDALAQIELSELYRWGGRGVPADKLRTVLWLRRAADQGDAEAQLELGALYLGSQPLDPPDSEDKVQALVWLTLAARGPPGPDASRATDLAARVDAQLTPAERAKAERLIEAWRPVAEPRTAGPQVADDNVQSIPVTAAQRAEAARLWAKWRPPTVVEAKAELAAAHAYDMSLGSSEAKVTVVEYATIGTWGAARFNHEVIPHLMAKYVTSGRVRFIFREVSISGIASDDGFLAARCAGPDRYFAMLNAIYRAPPLLDEPEDQLAFAARLEQITGLPSERLAQCLSDRDAITALHARTRAYTDIERLDVAPTFEINGVRFERFMNVHRLDRAIDRAMAKR